VKRAEERSGVGEFSEAEDQSSSCIVDELQRSDGLSRISVQREEEGTQDGALRKPSSEGTSYPVSAAVEVG